MSYGFGITLKSSVTDAVDIVTEALKQQGFGVLSDIDVQAALKNKLGLERPGYRILGACNPKLADQAIQAEPDIGLLLPCNVLIREEGDGVRVLFIDPEELLGVTGREDIRPMAKEVRRLLDRVSESLLQERF